MRNLTPLMVALDNLDAALAASGILRSSEPLSPAELRQVSRLRTLANTATIYAEDLNGGNVFGEGES